MKMKFAYLCNLLFIVLAATACANAGEKPTASKEEVSTTTESSSTTESESIDSVAPNEKISSTADCVSENISASREYSVGDIILSGGSSIKAYELTALNANDLPVAVVAGVKDNGAFFAVGVYRSNEPLQWKSAETEKFPAFDFISGYAKNHGLTGEMTSGWYMPSIEELRTLYKNRDAVNETLEMIYQLDNNAAMNGLSTTWYWSSTQSESQDDYAWFVHFYNGYAGECPKAFTNVNVIAVREL